MMIAAGGVADWSRRTACPEEADDLIQKIFTRALSVEPRTPVLNPDGYLTRVAQNLLRDRAKLARRRSADLHVPADESIFAGLDQYCLLEARDIIFIHARRLDEVQRG